MPDIARILEHLHATRQKLLATIASVPDQYWLDAPRAGAWSPAQVVAHVTQVERAVNKNSTRLLSAPLVSIPFHKRLHFPIRISTWRAFRVKATIPMKSELLGDKDKLIASLAAARKVTTEFLEANRDQNLGAYYAPHPFLGNLNVYDWYHFVAYHEERHRKQIREIVETFQL
ncbi:MAG: DinB family protein [Candidatus Acidiferrales bacterium]|jgi:hypothetical protein